MFGDQQVTLTESENHNQNIGSDVQQIWDVFGVPFVLSCSYPQRATRSKVIFVIEP